ncbi:MAG: terminase large subunit [Deltaproteobacteria bacterium]|nr:terminase large subunit [Deltaproteobacteria bacterium]
MKYPYNREEFDYKVAERTIKFIEAVCIIPEGTHVGKPLRLEDFQKKYILDVFRVDRITGRRRVREGILTIGRKNGKTAFMAALVIAALSGPLSARNAEISSIALTRDQAAVIYRYANGYVKMNHRLTDRIKSVDSKKHLIDLEIGSNYTALSADHRSQLGKSPAICFFDEAGAFRQDRELYDAMMTAQGAHSDPLMLILSTEAPSDQDLFAEMVDYCINNPDDESEYLMRFSVPPEDDPWLEANWYKGNPALGKFLNLDDFRIAAKKAEAMPGARSNFFNLRLNQRVDAEQSFLSRDVWLDKLHDREPTFEDLRGLKVAIGIDIAERRDLCGIVFTAYNPEVEGEIIVVPTAFLPKGALAERQEEDKVDYRRWVETGHLLTPSGNSLDFDWVAQWMVKVVDDYDLTVATGGVDPWKWPHLQKSLKDAGADTRFSKVEKFIQGYISMSPAVDCLESAVYDDMMWHGNSPVLTWNISNVVITQDAANNRKMDKKRSYQKIDLAVALAMASKTMDVIKDGSYLDTVEEVLFI